jgi:hypothetical protein
MMSPEPSLAQWLFRTDSEGREPVVYFLADGARDRRIFPLVTSPWVESVCLFDGDLPPEFRRAAPYLARLERGGEETEEILELGWGNAWGVFLRSTADLDALKQHFRTLLVVQDEQGRRLFFRFYDPRVLRVYLPTCNREELDRVFGPVEAFLLEGEEPSRRLLFRRAERDITALYD